jgi:hypothetical protein
MERWKEGRESRVERERERERERWKQGEKERGEDGWER